MSGEGPLGDSEGLEAPLTPTLSPRAGRGSAGLVRVAYVAQLGFASACCSLYRASCAHSSVTLK